MGADGILVINAGSSSLKISLFRRGIGTELALVARGQAEGLGTSHARLSLRARDGTVLADEPLEAGRAADHRDALAALGPALRAGAPGLAVGAVGHRVVHGGPSLATPVPVDDALLATLEDLVPLAPLHQPHNLAAIRAVAERLPGVPQVACFDTAFHRGHPEVAEVFALPREYHDAGVRRYGFHGLSYEYVASVLPQVAPAIAGGRVVVAHLGSGASLCALRGGHSVDSTMSFTPLDGVPMGTRPGALDPGVVLYLLAERHLSAQEIETLLYHRSGLLGLSGVSNDMRDLLGSTDVRARLAIEHFVYRISKELGALAAVLGGIDGLVFTAGIGEHSPEIRTRVCQAAAWLGVELDAAANQVHGPRISREPSRVSAWVIPTDEELMIARHTVAVLGSSPGPRGR